VSASTAGSRERPRPFADDWAAPGTPRPPTTISNPLGAAGRVEPTPLERPSLGPRYRRFEPTEIASIPRVDGRGGIDLSPDGSEVTFAWDRSGAWEIYTAPLSGDRIIQLTEADAVSRSPRWSPDAAWVAFLRDGGADRGAIWLVDRDGEHERRLTPSGATFADITWSPDGRRLAAVDTKGDLVTVDATNGDVQRVAHGTQPRWSLDGRSIVFTAAVDRTRTDVAVVASSGGEPRIFGTAGDGSSSDARWSPDGSHIALTTSARGHREVAFARVQDGKAGATDHLGATPLDAAEPVWRPDGRGIVYRRWSDGNVALRRAFTISHAEDAVSDVPGVHWSPQVAPDSETVAAVLSSSTWSADVVVRPKGAIELARVTSSLAGVDHGAFITPIAMGSALVYLPPLEALSGRPQIVFAAGTADRRWSAFAQLLASRGRVVIIATQADASAALAAADRQGLGDGRGARTITFPSDLTYAKRSQRAAAFESLLAGIEGTAEGG
jgi:Tol biopolymer transport system component